MQSYALQIFLKKQGHEVWLIKRVPEDITVTITNRIKNFIKIILGRKIKEITHNMLAFENDYMQKTDIISNDGNFHLLDKYKFDACIAGSDQVWRFDYTQSRRKNYFLDFITSNTVKKISFSASFGIDEWKLSEKDTAEIAELIHKFDIVSIREKAGVDLCQKHLNCEATLLLDPAFLLTINEYRRLYTGDEPENKGKILLYFLDHHKPARKIINTVSQHLHKEVFSIGKETINVWFKKEIYYPPISNWIKGFDDASFVITDSFHGCVFSIIFKKPFIVLGNQERGMSRFTSLLDIFGFTNQLIYNKDINSFQIHNLDFTNVDNIINENFQKSKEFVSILNS
ncbi:MAG: polysaccharide pyruvyl transferase family protein [Bacteroidales bacterium]|nr:polysaccharide pyruvyl transferase family protein [Bacteroidales bacterium]